MVPGKMPTATSGTADLSRPRYVGVATSQRRLGTSFYSRKLFDAIGAELLATEQPMARLLESIRSKQPRLCHLEFEYRAFGGPLRTLWALPFFASRVARQCPLVITFHGVVAKDTLPSLRGRLNFRVYRAMVRRVARPAARVVVLSERMRSELATGYGITNVEVIPHGSDPPMDVGPVPEQPLLLFFGFLRPSKGLLELLDAFALVAAEFPQLRLVIAGTPAKAHEADFVRTLERAIAVHPFRDRITLRNEYIDDRERNRLGRGARLIVLPYTDRFVEVSGVLHDFASCGAPVLCSDTPRFSELVDGVEALRVPPTPAALAAGIRRILSDENLRKRLREGLARLSERQSWEGIAEAHRQMYERILQPGTDAPRD